MRHARSILVLCLLVLIVSDAAAQGQSGRRRRTKDLLIQPVRYVERMRLYKPMAIDEIGLNVYYDYDEALDAAKQLKKPVMLDFTGVNCVNCRKMEKLVWANPEVAKRLKEDFIVVSLYEDLNKIELPPSQQYFSKVLNKQVKTLADRNQDLQESKFSSNSQPYYFYVDEDGKKLVDKGYSYDPDVSHFIAHLELVKANYKKRHFK